MEIRVLRYFLAIAREESFSGAAGFLHISQPTLSRQIMELEKELGAKLFLRGNRKITLTNEGLLLRKRAGEILALVDKTAAEFNAPDEIVSGDIHIGCGETDAMRPVAKVIKALQERCPNIRYHFFSGNADDVTERLDKGLLDFGILIDPADIHKYEFLPLPGIDLWGVLMRRDSPLAAQDAISPEDLWKLPLIVSRQTLAAPDLFRWLKQPAENLHIVATYNLLYNASLLVEAGHGYALCLDKIIRTDGDSTLCFRPLAPHLEAAPNLVWKKYQIFSEGDRDLLKKPANRISFFHVKSAERSQRNISLRSFG